MTPISSWWNPLCVGLLACVLGACGQQADSKPKRAATEGAKASTQGAGPAFVAPPTVRANPNERAPLVAILDVESASPVEVVAHIDDGERSWDQRFEAGGELALVGMRPGRRHEIQVSLRDASGAETSHPEALEFTTPALPEDPGEFPPIEARVSKPDQMEPGVSLLSVRRVKPRAKAFNSSYGLIVGLDAAGEVVWYYRSDARVSDIELLANGHILYVTHDFRIVEIDLRGEVVASWYAARRPQGPVEGATPVDALTFHHEVDVLPSGNLLAMSTEIEEIEDYPQIEREPSEARATERVMVDRVIEFKRDGTIVWDWNAFESLEPTRVGYDLYPVYWHERGFPDVGDWTHGNGLFHRAEDDSLLVSLRLQDAVVKVDRATKQLRWILGDGTGWPEPLAAKTFAIEGAERWFYHQHFPILTSAGTLVLYDNGVFLTRPPAPPQPLATSFSRAVEYALDEDNKVARQVWASDEPSDETKGNCATMGQIDPLNQTGNLLVSYGRCHVDGRLKNLAWTRAREYGPGPERELVWEVEMRPEQEDGVGWVIYGAERGPLRQ